MPAGKKNIVLLMGRYQNNCERNKQNIAENILWHIYWYLIGFLDLCRIKLFIYQENPGAVNQQYC